MLPVTRLSAPQVAACRSLTLRAEGTMSETLTYARRSERGSRAILAHERPGGRLLGWCLLTEGGQANFYVRVSARRQGIGSSLMRESLRLSQRQIKVESHDDPSFFFFDRFSDQIQLGGWYLPRDWEEWDDE